MTKITVWHGCYDGNLKGLITPEAMKHPAKMSRRLCERIFDHGIEMGYWKPGDVIVDPFAGISTTLLVGAYRGFRVIGVELEPKFVRMATGYECDGTVDTEARPVHTPDEFDPGGWFVRLRPEAAYWGVSKGRHDGGHTGYGFDDRAEAEALADWLAKNQPVEGRWDRAAYSVIYVDPVDREGHDEVQTVIVRKAECGKDKAHEPHHVTGNIELNLPKWRALGRPIPVIVQGDSRQLRQHVAEAMGAFTSPPYSDQPTRNGGALTQWPGKRRIGASQNQNEGYGQTPGQLSNMKTGDVQQAINAITSPPFARDTDLHGDLRPDDGRPSGRADNARNYGGSPGQIAVLPAGDVKQAISAITSPPFAGNSGGTGPASADPLNAKYPGLFERHLGSMNNGAGYGASEGQINAMPTGDVQQAINAITSPPYEETHIAGKSGNGSYGDDFRRTGKGPRALGQMANEQYGATDGQIGKEKGETYWQACAEVYKELYALLPFAVMQRGGVAAIVVKDFVKNGKRVPLCDHTCQLLEALGFTVVERCRAMVVKERKSITLHGQVHTKLIERKSYFRRNAEKKGAPRIDWEEVIWARKL